MEETRLKAKDGREEESVWIHDDTEICSIDDQISCSVSDGSILLSLKDGIYYGLNPVACRIWELIQEPIRFKEILRTLITEYEVDPARCDEEIRRFLTEMNSKDLILIRNGAQAD